MVDHQRINGTSFVFSTAVPALLTVSASEGLLQDIMDEVLVQGV